MDNKSMGSFLAQLRKEKNITQKELAEFLNVSDKTVSHWERGENSPDLSVIPLIAEYFGVTCDELLKGERKQVAYDNNSFSYEPIGKQTEYEKYAKRRLQIAYAKLKSSMVITVFVSIVTVAFMSTLMWILDYQLYDFFYGSSSFIEYGIPASAIFGASLFMLLTYLSYQKFKSALNFCDLDKNELSHWKKKSALVIMIPFIPCLFALIVFFYAVMPAKSAPTEPPQIVSVTPPPTYKHDDITSATGPVQSIHSDEADSSVPISGEINIFTD